jgi:hypothetical protein
MKATNKSGKKNDDFGFPKPQPGKFRPQISTTFSSGAQPEPNVVTITGMPKLAAMLQEVGMKVLETQVEDGEPLDIEPADCVFAGEMAVAVASAKNGNSSLSTRIQAIDVEVPQPLFEIADAIGAVTDDNGVAHPLANADKLAINHFVAAAFTASKPGTVEEVERITREANSYVPFPADKPVYLVPKELASHDDFSKAKVAMERSVSPSFWTNRVKNDWISSAAKYEKKVKDSSFLGWLIINRKELTKGRVSQKEEYIMQIGHIMLRDKYPTIRHYAEAITTDSDLRRLGVLELDELFRLVDVQAKRCKRSIGRLLATVFPVKRTREISPEGDTSMLVNVTAEYMETCGKVDDQALTTAFLGGFTNTNCDKGCHYRPHEDWRAFAYKWISSFQIDNG